ncbi:L-histidine N(alpha)-methyltransferase [Mucilaginibacter sp. E4BP6]|uniref:L-histidine N(alpha)-methyltransferase n=1 Tax=Mucilaginibacter sp. E4BP6 TaxID=2723089 RepID=UPI0015C8218F|nr:L-histidine N(alpha)-methyltransferase [Mucilaginibacter sp. E4BP6]NYE67030.1 dimethylhistidine N-methyltransferase [Mucilaginibacter sp. E4BP6]
MTTSNFNIEKIIAISTPEKEEVTFCKDVIEGLSSSPKFLQSKYFYDCAGDSLFQEIMDCEEYYPFNCELEIFRERTKDLADIILRQSTSFDLIELGAGDCTKSNYLLKYLVDINADFTYRPIDISANIIDYLHLELPVTVPGINVEGLNGDYFEMLGKAKDLSSNRKVVLFLGSNLGNMLPAEAIAFCQELRQNLNQGDIAIIGLDLKKHPATILAAYNDKAGITSAFNLNLLQRINRELNANFDTNQFEHYPVYDPETGSCKSYLISLEDQSVEINTKRGFKTIHFKKNESIFMEVSQKYTPEQITCLAKQASFKPIKMLYDQKKWFVDTIWQVL